jgi:hypothetical protein
MLSTMLVARVTRSILLLAALLLGLGPAQAMFADVCTSSATAMTDAGSSGCDCNASDCERGAPVSCGQCLAIASERTSAPDLLRPVTRQALDAADRHAQGFSPEPLVPPPRMAA